MSMFFLNRGSGCCRLLDWNLGVSLTTQSACPHMQTKQRVLSAQTCSSSSAAARCRSLWIILYCFLVAASSLPPIRASEYEVQGNIRQSIVQLHAAESEYETKFTVFVRDCGWLIQMMDENGTVSGYQREIGSTNGVDIFEYYPHADGRNPANQPVTNTTGRHGASGPAGGQTPGSNSAFIKSGNLPVGLLDREVVGHLWLMFASQCYWSGLKTRMLTPLYDWHAAVPGDPKMKTKVAAEWELLNGPGSLPREVSYLGRWEETNGHYRATGMIMAGGTMIPKGFIFEERHAQPFGMGMVLRKRLDAEVISVRPVCSRSSLVPVPLGSTSIVDWRLRGPGRSAPIPGYMNPVPGKWPTLAESRELANANLERNLNSRRLPPPPPRTRPWMVGVICAVLLAPLGLFLRGKKS
jgi:hypothetical protein